MFTYACLHFQDEVITQLQQNIQKGCPYKKMGYNRCYRYIIWLHFLCSSLLNNYVQNVGVLKNSFPFFLLNKITMNRVKSISSRKSQSDEIQLIFSHKRFDNNTKLRKRKSIYFYIILYPNHWLSLRKWKWNNLDFDFMIYIYWYVDEPHSKYFTINIML